MSPAAFRPLHDENRRRGRLRTVLGTALGLLALTSLPASATEPERDEVSVNASIPFPVFESWTVPEHFESFLDCFTPDFGTISNKRITPPANGSGPTHITFTSVPKKMTSRAVVARMDLAMDVTRLSSSGCVPPRIGFSFDLTPTSVKVVTSVGVPLKPATNGVRARLTLCGAPTPDGNTEISLAMELRRPATESQDSTMKTLVSPKELMRNNLSVVLRSLSPGGCASASWQEAEEAFQQQLSPTRGCPQ